MISYDVALFALCTVGNTEAECFASTSPLPASRSGRHEPFCTDGMYRWNKYTKKWIGKQPKRRSAQKKRRIPKLNRRSVMQKKPRGAIIQRSMTCHTSSCHDSPRQTSLLYQPSNSTVKYTSPPHRQLPRQPHERLIRSAHLSQHLTCPGVFELSAGIVQRHAERPPVALRRDIEHRIHHHRLAD